jgi:L-2,4-diaminobutyric acid acetyltransferase
MGYRISEAMKGASPEAGDKRKGRVDGVTIRTARKEDGAALWQLVKESGVLDLNSAYAYIIMGEYFSDTCLVAEMNGHPIGFVNAFRPPSDPRTIFVWQIGVSKAGRGMGIGNRLLTHLVLQEIQKGAQYLESTVSPTNEASQALFRGVSRDFHALCHESEFIGEELFPNEGHEAEHKFRIGPFSTQQ